MRFLKQSHSAEKLERGDPLATKKIRKKSRTVPKKMKESHSAEKNCSKKFLAKARTRTRDRKPSTDEYM